METNARNLLRDTWTNLKRSSVCHSVGRRGKHDGCVPYVVHWLIVKHDPSDPALGLEKNRGNLFFGPALAESQYASG